MKAQLLAATAVFAVLSAGSALAQSSDRTASDLTRDLNSLPSGAAIAPVSPTPAPTPALAQTPAATPPPPAAPHQARPATTTPAPAPAASASTLNTTTYGPPATPVAPPASAPRPTTTPAPAPRPATTTPAPTPRSATTTPAPSTPAPRPSTPATAPTPAPSATRPTTTPAPATPMPRPSTTPAPSAAVPTPAAAAPTPAPAPAPAVVAMDAAAISALPFSLTLPPGFVLIEGRAGPNAHIYSVKRGDETFAMIYTGASSQFPIYDGQMVQAGGRTSIVITEDGRRTAAEHLFQRATAPAEVHVWISSLDGADRVLAESIAQSVDVR